MGTNMQICSNVPCTKKENAYESHILTKNFIYNSIKKVNQNKVRSKTNSSKSTSSHSYTSKIIFLQRKIRLFLRKIKIGVDNGDTLSMIRRVCISFIHIEQDK